VGNYLMNDTSSMFKAYVRPHVRTNPKTGQKITVDGYNNSKPSKPHLQAPAMDRREWIGVDLDKTLAPRAGQKVLTWKDPALRLASQEAPHSKGCVSAQGVSLHADTHCGPQQRETVRPTRPYHLRRKLVTSMCISVSRTMHLYETLIGQDQHRSRKTRKNVIANLGGNTQPLRCITTSSIACHFRGSIGPRTSSRMLGLSSSSQP